MHKSFKISIAAIIAVMVGTAVFWLLPVELDRGANYCPPSADGCLAIYLSEHTIDRVTHVQAWAEAKQAVEAKKHQSNDLEGYNPSDGNAIPTYRYSKVRFAGSSLVAGILTGVFIYSLSDLVRFLRHSFKLTKGNSLRLSRNSRK